MNDDSSATAVAESLRAELNRFSPGEKLPSSRTLVQRFRVSPVTVSRALSALAAEGLVILRPGAGTYRAPNHAARIGSIDTSWQQVALTTQDPDGPPRVVDASGVLANFATHAQDVIPFNEGYLHPTLAPERELTTALARAARRAGAWERPPVDGLTALRTWFGRGAGVGPAQVLVTAGGQAALTASLRALAPPGAPVLVESPTYPGVLAVARAAGLRLVPVPIDADGVRPDLLADAFSASGARVFLCQPLFQNPTGAVLADARRRVVLDIAHAAGAFVIEDDFARHLGHGDPLPPPLISEDRHGTVVHITSLTKPTSPNLRVGAMIARGPALERLRAVHFVDNFFVPRPLQEAALELVGAPAWPRHLRAVASGLRERRVAMVAALERELPGLLPKPVPFGGYHLWLRLPDGTDETALTYAALRTGVAISPGRPYFPAEAPAPHLRIAFAATAGPEEIVEGVERLSRALAETAPGL
ncbi:aminotransferase-like domain-containing protein [Streptomyces sp. NBC_00448]|uniref:aminotransferase-like domain-containing protein n=1 Tax=Streptomyces sp. NBC_00448 TaxID=2903652 RepID=UPI002E1D5EA4